MKINNSRMQESLMQSIPRMNSRKRERKTDKGLNPSLDNQDADEAYPPDVCFHMSSHSLLY